MRSHLTTAIQIADIIAYIIAWGLRVGNMSAPARQELGNLAEKVRDLRYQTKKEMPGHDSFTIWSIAVIDDLRPREERFSA